MVAARIPWCSVSVITRSTNLSPPIVETAPATVVLSAGASCVVLGFATGADDTDGALAALGAATLPVLAVIPAAFLHRSESESLCSLRQATMRPPPGCTPAQSFCASPAHAARRSASDG